MTIEAKKKLVSDVCGNLFLFIEYEFSEMYLSKRIIKIPQHDETGKNGGGRKIKVLQRSKDN